MYAVYEKLALNIKAEIDEKQKDGQRGTVSPNHDKAGEARLTSDKVGLTAGNLSRTKRNIL